MEIET
jgi:hypothetical protein